MGCMVKLFKALYGSRVLWELQQNVGNRLVVVIATASVAKPEAIQNTMRILDGVATLAMTMGILRTSP